MEKPTDRDRLLASVRRSRPRSLPPHTEVFRNNVRVQWNLQGADKEHRLKLVDDVLGKEGEENRLDWDDIVGCREQKIVAEWLSEEIARTSESVLGNTKINGDEALLEEVAIAIRLDKIPYPCTIYHIAAAHNNIPIYELFATIGFFGQDVRYDISNIDHEKNGRLPWEVAVGKDPDTIGIFAKKAFLKWTKETDDEGLEVINVTN